MLRCSEGKLDVFVAADVVLDTDLDGLTPVRVRWDDYEPIPSKWTASTDRVAAFVRDKDGFVNEGLLVASALRLELHPVDQAPIVAIFDVRDYKNYAAELKATCPRAKLRTKASGTP